MPSLSIPRTDRKGLTILRELPPQVYADFLSAIQRSPDAVPVVSGMSSENAELLAETLNNLYQVRAYNDVATDKFISDVCESLAEHGELKSAEESQLRGRLASLLDVEALTVSSKASLLAGEYPYVYCGARIVTDIRPVFGRDVSVPPPVMVLAHTLKLDYHGAGGHLHELYVALRADDLVQLRELIDRAEIKAKNLEAVLKPLDSKLINP